MSSQQQQQHYSPSLLPKRWIPANHSITTTTRSLSSAQASELSKSSSSSSKKEQDYNDVLSVALDQSNVSIAQSLIDNTFTLLRKNNPESAWECYKDLTCRHIQKYLSRDQYKQLIKQFNHSKVQHTQGLEYLLTLVEDMKHLGYKVGRKEKLLVMRSLGLNGNLSAMEKVFEDLKSEQLLITQQLSADGVAQKPFNIMLTSYGEHADTVGSTVVAEKSMDLYGQMLDMNIQPTPGSTRLLVDNIKLAERSDEMIEKVWDWLWTKIGMNVGGKTKELEPSLYRDMVMYFSNVGRPEYALEINDIMTKRKIQKNTHMLTALIHKVGRSGDVNRSLELFEEMKSTEGLEPTLATYNALIDIYAHKKPTPDIQRATSIYEKLGDVGFVPDHVTFGSLIDMFAKTGDLSGVKRLYFDMSESYKIKANPHIYSSFIECFIKLNDHESAMDVLKILKKQSSHNLKPARETYNLLIKGLVQSNLIQEAIKLLSVMTKEDMKLEARTFTPLLTYFAQRGEPDGAHKVASMMTQAKVKPVSHTYTSLLNAYARAGDIVGAENIFKILKQKYRPNLYAYNALLYVYTKNNEMDKLLDTYKRMSKAFVTPNEYTYGILMYFYSRRKEVQSVEALFETMQSNHTTPNAISWTILMQTYFECGKIDKGRNILERMIQAGLEPTNVTWSIMIKGFVNAAQLDIAESVLQNCIEDAQHLRDAQSRRLLQDAQVYVNYDTTLPETIEDILNRASHKQHTQLKHNNTLSPYLFTPIIDAYKKAGKFEKAKQTFKNMLNLSVPITLPAYVDLMSIFLYESKHNAVEILWRGLYNRTSTSSVLEHIDPSFEEPILVPTMEYNYTNLLTLDEEDNEDELAASKSILPDQVSPFALSVYLESLMQQDRHNEVEALWSELSSNQYQFDEHNWNKYICSLVSEGKITKACQVINTHFFSSKTKEDDENGVKKTIRKRDDIFITNDDQLHNYTCTLLAAALDVTGAEGMGVMRLRSVVADKVKEHIQQHGKLDDLEEAKLDKSNLSLV